MNLPSINTIPSHYYMLFGLTITSSRLSLIFTLLLLFAGGMKRRVKDPTTKSRAREQSDVDCNEQQIDYCKTYHKIDKGNGAEAKYDLSTESHLHGVGLQSWLPVILI
jgi:hypothetical protein